MKLYDAEGGDNDSGWARHSYGVEGTTRTLGLLAERGVGDTGVGDGVDASVVTSKGDWIRGSGSDHDEDYRRRDLQYHGEDFVWNFCKCRDDGEPATSLFLALFEIMLVFSRFLRCFFADLLDFESDWHDGCEKNIRCWARGSVPNRNCLQW